MVITILDATVKQENWDRLERIYNQSVGHLDAGITQTFLLQGGKDPSAWKIVTVWESREALDAMRQSGETPRGVAIFREVGAEPVLSMHEVRSHGEKK